MSNLNTIQIGENLYGLGGHQNYSTEEQVIGTWVDGKPLYRKTIRFNDTIPGTGQVIFEVAHNILNYDMITIDMSHSFLQNSNGRTCMIIQVMYNSFAESSERLQVLIDKDVIRFLSDGEWGTSWVKYITLEYTKTTDTVESEVSE